jgi:DNA-binding NarL/FixJ family response regulator
LLASAEKPYPECVVEIVVIEDHVMVRGFVTRSSRETFPGASVHEASDGAHGLALCRQLKPDLVLLDLDLPDADGLDLAIQIREAASSTRILVLSSHADPYVVYRLQSAGITSFVDKNEQSPEMLGTAMRAVVEGRRYVSPLVERVHLALRTDAKAFSKVLSAREIELLRVFGRGLTNDEAATELKLTAFTVRNHRHNIMAKLGIQSTPALIRYAIENGFTRIRQKTV